MLNSLTLFKAYVFQDGGYRLFCTIRKNDVVTFLSKPAHPGDLLFRRGFTIWFFKLNSHAVINTACFIETHVRIWALLRRQAELDGMPAINAKRVYRIMRQNALLLERKTAVPPSKRAHTGKVAVKESNQRWCSDGFEFRCDNGEKLRVTFALDCCDREALHWAVTTGVFDSETVQDVMLGAVERRFGNELPASPVEWLTDNGSCYRANETRQFARMLGLEPKNTAVRSPESNGIAESFVKTIKRDYISIMPKPDGLTAAKNLAEAFEHYNEWHPHSALGYRSPREYLRQQASNGLSDNRCLEI